MAFLPPEVDKVGDEVDAWFVGDNESFLQASAHTQTVCPKLLQIRTCLLVEADIDLSETFHIVYVHTHHVSQSVRQEHRMGTGSYSLVGVALHQAELFQPFRHQTADGKVHIGIFHTGLGHFEHIVVTGFNDGVYLQLALRELTADRHRARVVGTIVVEFATSVAECQASFLKFGVRGVAVHDFPVLGEDGGKADALSQTAGHTVDLSSYKAFGNARTNQQLGCGMHRITHIAGSFDGLNLLRFLRGAHLYHSLDQL